LVAKADAEKRNGRVTIRDVAEDAGVSVAAVSKVLRDAYGVSDALRAKVRASMDQLGYRPLAAARGMRGQTYTLGLVLPDIRNPFFADIMVGVNNALDRTQYRSMIGISQSSPAGEMTIVEAMLDRQMDGIILIGSTETRQEIDRVATTKPLVAIGYHDRDAGNFDTVNNDDQQGAMLAVRHLVAAGYRNIAMLSLSTGTSTILSEREVGYRRAMLEAELGRHVNIIQIPNRPDAIFCWTDFIALEVISVVTELGLSIPDDLGIVGYDNTMFCDFAQNSLSSIDQSGELLGLQATRLLIERIKGRTEAEHFIVPPRLVARRSTGRTTTGARHPAV
jgi:DNA-binding LacI/PurR family transcriptional regulator